MCKSFDKWKEVFKKEDGKSAIDGLEDIFEDELLCDLLDLTEVTGSTKEVLSRKIALEQELHKAQTTVLQSLPDDKRDNAPKKRKELEETLKALTEFCNKQQGGADLLGKEISDIEKDVKKEEDTIKAQIKELEIMAKDVKDIDEQIKAKEAEKARKDAEYEETNEIKKDIDERKNSRKTIYGALENKQKQIKCKIKPGSSYVELLKKLETKKKEQEDYSSKVKQSNVIIDYINENRFSIVVKRAIKSV